MTTVLKVVATSLAGVLLGLFLTIYSLDPVDRGLAAGPWRVSPRDGTLDIDPYALATIARAGVLALGAAEGLTFEATHDSDGNILTPACDYAVIGPMPSARFWTVAALTPEGFPIPNPASRHAFTSAESLWKSDEPVVIAISPRAQAGNWLPVASTGGFILMLRLYDTGLSAVGTRFEANALPAIRVARCS